ncbi:MAG: class I SAM-dependent methyltransferase [Vicinamibacteria bacterium]|nr:class I SAM-dependent methyltransferase [Vicinamibacteria bacterium]
MNSDDVLRLAPNLRRLPNGVLVADSSRPISYPTDGNRLYFEIEDGSFWFRHRNDLLIDTLNRFPPAGVLVDVGGGNGFVTKALQNAGWDVILLEPGLEGALNAQRRGVRNIVNAAWEEAAFSSRVLGAIGLFDVLEHVADDLAFLRSLARRLMPGGRLFVTVPAHRWLWSFEDDRAGHVRRYTRKTIRRLMLQAGLDVERVSHFFTFLTLPVLLMRRLAFPGRRARKMSLQARQDHAPAQNAALRSVLAGLCAGERMLLRHGWSPPLGTSLLLVARAPSIENGGRPPRE